MVFASFFAVRRPLRVLLGGLGLMGSLLAGGEARAGASSTYAYGISNNQEIFEIDLTAGTQAKVFDTASIICAGLSGAPQTSCQTTGSDFYASNNFAYDPARNLFYFVDYTGNLRYWDRSPSSLLPVIGSTLNPGAGQPDFGLGVQTPETNAAGVTGVRSSFTANAAYYNDAYWYFFASDTPYTGTVNPRGKLVKVSLAYSGNTPSVSGFEYFTVPGLPGNGQQTDNTLSDYFGFGDISIDRDNGELYGATVKGALFRVDVDGCGVSVAGECPSADLLLDGTTGNRNPSLQITFNGDYSVLYGTTFAANSNGSGSTAGGWGTIDLTTGRYTEFTGPSAFTTIRLRDIGGSSTSSLVPGPLPLLGVGAAFGWSRRLRRRQRSS